MQKFSRVWLLQEYVLSQQVSVVCNEFVFDWNRFFYTCVISSIRDSEAQKRSGRLYQLHQLRQEWKAQQSIPLHRAISMTLSRHCERPHDHIFGILGLSPTVDEELKPPDYREGFLSLSARYMSYFLRNSEFGALHDMLRFGNRTLVSWIPDFSSRTGTRNWEAATPLFNKTFKAGSTLQPNLSYVEQFQSFKLNLRAKKLGV
jgi:hypothetical protein